MLPLMGAKRGFPARIGKEAPIRPIALLQVERLLGRIDRVVIVIEHRA